jgi:iron(III) transport system substrate-binding protein
MIKRDDAGKKTNSRKAALTRRKLLLTASAGLMATTVLAPPHTSAFAQSSDAPNLEAARAEGPLVIWHGDQEADVVEYLKIFTRKTGIQTVEQRLLPGAALPKLEAEYRTGTSDADVWDNSDAGIMEQLRLQNRLLRYVPKEIDAYGGEYCSDPPGFWTTYYINVGPMMYDPRFVSDDAAPKTWMDLLDSRWKDQIGFQNSSAGTSYGFWFVLKDILPKDYWERLAAQKPRAYSSSTQIQQDIERGDLKIGGRVSAFQIVKALREKNPVKAVFPPEGTPAVNQIVGIIGNTKRPNAAKIYVDFLLSREGQQIWNDLQGSYSARTDVTIENLPQLKSLKLLLPTDAKEYMLPARRKEFVAIWNKMTGL